MIPPAFDYHAPRSVGEALSLLGTLGSDAKLLAGGHSLLPMMKLRFAQPAHLIDLNRIPALRGIREEGGDIVIGAMTVENELIALFLPHGIGHMVGLGVRDATGPLPGRKRDIKFAGMKIRMDIPLDENYLVTVEPGLYFNKALLTSTKQREKYKSAVNWNKIEPWIGKVGIRIEDNILVTAAGPVNVTSEIPK